MSPRPCPAPPSPHSCQQASEAPLWRWRNQQPSGSAHPASLLPCTQPRGCPTLGLAVQVDLGPVVQSEQGEEGEDGSEDVLETLGVRLAEHRPEHHGEENWLSGPNQARRAPFTLSPAPPRPRLPPQPGRLLPRPAAQDTEAGKHEDKDGGDGWQGPRQGPGHFLEAGQEAVGRG